MEHRIYFNEEWNPPLTKEVLIKKKRCCALDCENCPYTKPRVEGNRELE